MEEFNPEKSFYDRNRIALTLFVLITLAFVILALTPGIGYSVDVHMQLWGGGRAVAGQIEGGSAYVTLYRGNITANFNPLFYPVNFISGRSTMFVRFTRAAESAWDIYGHETAKMVILGVLTVEFAKNLPLLVAITCLISLGLRRLANIAQARGLKQVLASIKRPFHRI